MSIDIADVDVGKNIGAYLQTEQAEADKRIAQAKAEERRAMAVAQEQEMKARVVEMKALVVESESQVPLAMAEALRGGQIGVMDYMNLKISKPTRRCAVRSAKWAIRITTVPRTISNEYNKQGR